MIELDLSAIIWKEFSLVLSSKIGFKYLTTYHLKLLLIILIRYFIWPLTINPSYLHLFFHSFKLTKNLYSIICPFIRCLPFLAIECCPSIYLSKNLLNSPIDKSHTESQHLALVSSGGLTADYSCTSFGPLPPP